MKNKKSNADKAIFWILTVLVFLIIVLVVIYNYGFIFGDNFFTGRATDVGVTNVTWVSTAGIQVTGMMAVGSGYFNSTCNSTAANIDSNHTYDGNYINLTNDTFFSPAIFPFCWINTTAIFDGLNRNGSNFTITNNGTGSSINVSVIANYNGEEWLCGLAGCSLTNNAALDIYSTNLEIGSCTSGLTTGYESMITPTLNNTVGLCDSLQYGDSADSITIDLNITIPKDTTSGTHNLNLTFTGLAV